jgi:hypothetical protein
MKAVRAQDTASGGARSSTHQELPISMMPVTMPARASRLPTIPNAYQVYRRSRSPCPLTALRRGANSLPPDCAEGVPGGSAARTAVWGMVGLRVSSRIWPT